MTVKLWLFNLTFLCTSVHNVAMKDWLEKNLTKKQFDFFMQLKEVYQTLALPSYEKIKQDLGYKSKNSIRQYLEILKEKNVILALNNNLYINPEFFKAKFVMSRVRAGFAGIMDDKIEQRISMDEILEINSPSTFVFKVSGDSMCEIGIYENDYVIIKKQQNAKVGDIVLAVIDNEFTLKTLKKDKNGMYLQPENKNYPIIRPKFSLTIFGVAIGITRKLI